MKLLLMFGSDHHSPVSRNIRNPGNGRPRPPLATPFLILLSSPNSDGLDIASAGIDRPFWLKCRHKMLAGSHYI